MYYDTKFFQGTSHSIIHSRTLFTFSICLRRCIHIIAAAPSSTCNMQHACLLQDDSADSFDAVACSCLQISLFVCLSVSVYFLRFLSLRCSYCYSFCCCCCSFSGCCCCFRLCTVALIIVSQTVACMCNLRLFTYSLIYIYICFRILINLCALHSPKEREKKREAL